MCPGGFVVAAASEKERVVTNGMSNYRRDSGIANSALLVQVAPEDFGQEVLAGMALQQELEGLAFELGGAITSRRCRRSATSSRAGAARRTS